MNDNYAPLGLLTFLTFGISVIAAVMAIDMYKLLRTGDAGKTWRLLITACVMFALLQVLKMAEILNPHTVAQYHLSEVVELCFAIAIAYAFYLQRELFTKQSKISADLEAEQDETEDDTDYALSSPHQEEDDIDDELEGTQNSQWPNVANFESEHSSAHR